VTDRMLPLLAAGLVVLGLGRAEAGEATGRACLKRAVGWLVAQQEADGRWDCARHGGTGDGDVGVTALAALAMIRADSAGRDLAIGRALDRLVAFQREDGMYIGATSGHPAYGHAMATIAMAEGLARIRSNRHRASLARALAYSAAARNPGQSWRYRVRRGDNDTAISGWMIEGYLAAREAGVENPDHDAGVAGVTWWLDRVTEPTYGRVGYTQRGNGPSRPDGTHLRFKADRTESLTAVGLALRLRFGETLASPLVRKQLGRCVACLPRWEHDGSIDMHYWYWGSRAMAAADGVAVSRWRDALFAALGRGQSADGSWDPVGPWGRYGGRVYSTAIGALALAAVVDPTRSEAIARLVLFPPRPLEGESLALVDRLCAELRSEAFAVRDAAFRRLVEAARADPSVAIHLRGARARASEAEERERLDRCLAGLEWQPAALAMIRRERLATDREYLRRLLDGFGEEIRAAAKARLEALD